MAHHITVYGSSWRSDCKRAKRFLGDQQVEYKWVDVEQDQGGRAFVEKVNDGKDIIPTILFEDGSVLVEQAARFDVEMVSAAEVAAVTEEGHDRVVRTEEGAEYRGHAVILAPGNT